MIIALAGKGGVGKTSLAGILIDELARRHYKQKLLVIDADPAATLAMTLGIDAPAVTLADIRDDTPLDAGQIKQLPPGTSPARFVRDRLASDGVIARRRLRELAFDLLLMGHGQGPGCFCRINQALTQALASIQAEYDLIIIDNEAGLEHVSRYRLNRVDLFLLVLTPGQTSWQVANRIKATAEATGISIGQTWYLYNRVYETSRLGSPGPRTLLLPECSTLMMFDRQGGPLHALAGNHPLRRALTPLIEQILAETTIATLTAIPFLSRLPADGGDSLPEIEPGIEPFRRPDAGI
ncbi:MAG: AAA family ATPase [Anaerolineales bacterium]|nr:AAA family ATPase [Anaerolineales bacterium]